MNWLLFWKRRRTDAGPQRAPNPFEEVRLGAQAQTLLDSESYQRAIELMRVRIHEAWAATEISDRDGQNELRIALSVLDGLESHVRTEAETGRMAKAQIETKKVA